MNYSELSIKELKAIASGFNAVPVGDKRSKQSWVAAIELAQSVEATETVKTIDRDKWVAPETVSDAQMEEIAYAVDESALTQSVKIATEIIEPAPTPNKVLNSNSTIESDSPIPKVSEQTVPNQQRGASTVALIVVLAFGVAFLVIKSGFTSIAWVIAALVPLALRLWRYLFPDPKHQDSIDYSPLPAG